MGLGAASGVFLRESTPKFGLQLLYVARVFKHRSEC